MIANIRIRGQTESCFLCQLDIMKYSKEIILERIKNKGIREDSFFICGISDWEVDTIMTLDEAYLLKRCIEGLYDGDEYVVSYLLKSHFSIKDIITHYWVFKSKDEVEVIQLILKGVDTDKLIKQFFEYGNFSSMFLAYVEAGYILNTPRGFYVQG